VAGRATRGGASERRAVILDVLQSTGFSSVEALSRRLDVSAMTVRRDLRELAQTDAVRIVHGGVSLPPDRHPQRAFTARAATNTAAKEAIGQLASGLVSANDTIIIDAGSTTYELAAALPHDFAGSVITASIPVIRLLMSRGNTRTIGLGGDVFPPSEAFVGPMTVESASHLKARTLFLGAAAVDEQGIYVAADVERPTKQSLLEIADVVVLLADAAKFHASAPIRLCGLERLNAIVTDRTPEAGIAGRLEAYGVLSHVADS
jgi:DeoR/GlpR family transcriptional regulator of sugar metabolism